MKCYSLYDRLRMCMKIPYATWLLSFYSILYVYCTYSSQDKKRWTKYSSCKMQSNTVIDIRGVNEIVKFKKQWVFVIQVA